MCYTFMYQTFSQLIIISNYYIKQTNTFLTCAPMPILPLFRVPIATLYPSPNFPRILLSGTYHDNARTTRNLSSHMTCESYTISSTLHQQPCDHDSFHNCVTLTFDLLTSRSMHAEPMPESTCVPSLVLTDQVVFLLQHRQTHRPTHTQTNRRHSMPYPAHWLSQRRIKKSTNTVFVSVPVSGTDIHMSVVTTTRYLHQDIQYVHNLSCYETRIILKAQAMHCRFHPSILCTNKFYFWEQDATNTMQQGHQLMLDAAVTNHRVHNM